MNLRQQTVALVTVWNLLVAWSLTCIMTNLLLSSVVDAKPMSLTPSHRWATPCAGSVAVDGPGMLMVLADNDRAAADLDRFQPSLKKSSPTNAGDDNDDVHDDTPTIDWFKIRVLSTKARKLKKRVRDLMALYVKYRFRDESYAADLESQDFTLEGMPKIGQLTIGKVNNDNVTDVIQTAYNDLARAAVFIEQARIAENDAMTSAHGEPSFDFYFRRLEDDHEIGLYWLLCSLHGVMSTTGSRISDDVIADILNIPMVPVDRASLRHIRDYIMLRDVERILNQVSIDLAAVAYLNSPPTTTT